MAIVDVEFTVKTLYQRAGRTRVKPANVTFREGGATFLDYLQLFTRLVTFGDVRSLATHPTSTTCRQLSPEELSKAGVDQA